MSSPVGYGRPGVFVNEQFAPLVLNPFIPGQALPAFCGLYNRGPLAPTLVSSWQQFVNLYGGFSTSPGNYLPFAVSQFFLNGGTQCFVARIPNTDASTSVVTLEDIATPTPTPILTVNANSPGGWGNSIYVEIVSAGQPGRFNLNVYYAGTGVNQLVETFQDMSINPVDVRSILAIVNSPISGSSFVTVAETLPGGLYTAGVTDLALVSPTPLTGGGDGSNAPDLGAAAPYVFNELPNQILYINFPGLSNITTLTELAAWATSLSTIMLIIDGPPPNFPETEAQVAANYVNMTSGTNVLPNSTYLTVYGPWIQVTDPSSTVPGATKWLPPGGAVAGIWQSTEHTYGTVQSPAGIQARIDTAIQLETNWSNPSLNNLNNAYVNAIKYIPNIGIVVFGSRTLHPGYPDRYVAVRRMIIKLEQNLEWILQYALFQPNDALLWASITTTCTNYLTQLMQENQFAGQTPATAFQVICNSTNNSYATAAAGIVNVTVAVALVSPAEFIYITLTQFQGAGTTETTTTTGIQNFSGFY